MAKLNFSWSAYISSDCNHEIEIIPEMNVFFEWLIFPIINTQSPEKLIRTSLYNLAGNSPLSQSFLARVDVFYRVLIKKRLETLILDN